MSETKIDDGGPAFPQDDYPDRDPGLDEHPGRGMSLRDWFAGQALVGLLTSHRDSKSVIVETAYAVADAMLAERAKEAAT